MFEPQRESVRLRREREQKEKHDTAMALATLYGVVIGSILTFVIGAIAL